MTSTMALVKIILLVFSYAVLLNSCVFGLAESKQGSSTTVQPTTYPKNNFQLAIDSKCKDVYKKCSEKLCHRFSTIGWEKRMKRICKMTCGHCRQPAPPGCFKSEYGCCWDYITAAIGPGGKGCPPCEDNPRYPNVCQRFRTYCRRRKVSGKWMRVNCPDACGHCAIWQFK